MTSLIKQKTIRNETIFEGRTLHAGVKSKIKLIPLECNKGILFVRKDKNKDGYQIIAGERRWRAAQAAGVHEVPVVIKKTSDQLKKLGDDEKDLKVKIEKFRVDEVDHKNMAYQSGATNKGLYSIMDKVIRTGSRIAITISEKI